MQEKNVKGIIGLILALAAVVCIIVAWTPMTKWTGMGFDGKFSFYGTINMAMCGIAFVCAIAAIVFAGMAKRDVQKSGPRISGLVIGIICLIISLFSAMGVGLFSTLTEFVNSDGQQGLIAEAADNNPEFRQELDKIIAEFKKEAGAETQSPSNAASSDTSAASSDESAEKSAEEPEEQ